MKIKNIILILTISLAITSCEFKKYEILEGYAQGTTFRVVYESSKNYNIKIYELLEEFDKTLSTYQDSSIISMINKNDPTVEINEIFTTFFNQSKLAFENTNGYFDVTVGPLVKAWGFGVVEEFNRDSSSIDSIKEFIGMSKIKVEGKKLIKDDLRIYIDGNAIAQGQSVDFLAEFFEKEGLENYLIEIGGEVKSKGVNNIGEVWRVGIDKPLKGVSKKENYKQL